MTGVHIPEGFPWPPREPEVHPLPMPTDLPVQENLSVGGIVFSGPLPPGSVTIVTPMHDGGHKGPGFTPAYPPKPSPYPDQNPPPHMPPHTPRPHIANQPHHNPLRHQHHKSSLGNMAAFMAGKSEPRIYTEKELRFRNRWVPAIGVVGLTLIIGFNYTIGLPVTAKEEGLRTAVTNSETIASSEVALSNLYDIFPSAENPQQVHVSSVFTYDVPYTAEDGSTKYVLKDGKKPTVDTSQVLSLSIGSDPDASDKKIFSINASQGDDKKKVTVDMSKLTLDMHVKVSPEEVDQLRAGKLVDMGNKPVETKLILGDFFLGSEVQRDGLPIDATQEEKMRVAPLVSLIDEDKSLPVVLTALTYAKFAESISGAECYPQLRETIEALARKNIKDTLAKTGNTAVEVVFEGQPKLPTETIFTNDKSGNLAQLADPKKSGMSLTPDKLACNVLGEK